MRIHENLRSEQKDTMGRCVGSTQCILYERAVSCRVFRVNVQQTFTGKVFISTPRTPDRRTHRCKSAPLEGPWTTLQHPFTVNRVVNDEFMGARDCTGAIDTCLANRSRAETFRLGISLFLLLVLIDIGVNVLLREAPVLIAPPNVSLWWETDYDIRRFDDFTTQLLDFSYDTLDTLVLLVIRVVCTLLLVVLAVTVGRPKLDDLVDNANRCQPCQPLLINAGEGQLHALSSAAKTEHLESYERRKIAAVKKNVAVGCLFLVSSSTQIYLGIKVIKFTGHWDDGGEAAHAVMTLQGTLFFICVLLINAEAFVANRLVNVLCAEEGFLVPEFHQHRLFFTKVDGHVCDMCHNSSQNMYRCDVCDFDSCPACFNKKDKCTSEGIMRGDKGVRDVLDVGRFEYLMRGVRLIRPHLLLFLFALLCLMGQSIASLVVPHFQGQIFDRIIEAHHVCTDDPSSPDCHHEQAGFYTLMLYFIGLSLGMGCLQALRALSFQIVARRIGIWVRTRLFNTMMRQDIAFFDGMRTGDLQNRLSEDISTMVQPIYTTLSTVLSNLMILVGGVTMCFLTSWRLSMLAFTTILPMMHITGVYAEWSRGINKQIYQQCASQSHLLTPPFLPDAARSCGRCTAARAAR